MLIFILILWRNLLFLHIDRSIVQVILLHRVVLVWTRVKNILLVLAACLVRILNTRGHLVLRHHFRKNTAVYFRHRYEFLRPLRLCEIWLPGYALISLIYVTSSQFHTAFMWVHTISCPAPLFANPWAFRMSFQKLVSHIAMHHCWTNYRGACLEILSWITNS